MTDTVIISSIKEGNSKGYTMLVKRHKSRLYYFINGMVWNTMDAEDLTMITFEKAFRKLDKYNGKCKFSTWLFTIAKNTVRDFIREKSKMIFSSESIENFIRIEDKNYNPEEKLLHSETVEKIEECIEMLPERRRRVIELHIDGNKDEDIAEITGMNHVAVRTLLFRARQQLKAAI